MGRKSHQMTVIPREEVEGVGTILTRTGKSDEPMVEGSDNSAPSLLCGNCQSVLVRRTAGHQLVAVFFECGACGSINRP
jgi:hypothetical protein